MAKVLRRPKVSNRLLITSIYLILFSVSFLISKTVIDRGSDKVVAQKIDSSDAETKTIACRDGDKDDNLATILGNKIQEVDCIFGGCNSFF